MTRRLVGPRTSLTSLTIPLRSDLLVLTLFVGVESFATGGRLSSHWKLVTIVSVIQRPK